jgi:hypothetical protein
MLMSLIKSLLNSQRPLLRYICPALNVVFGPVSAHGFTEPVEANTFTYSSFDLFSCCTISVLGRVFL